MEQPKSSAKAIEIRRAKCREYYWKNRDKILEHHKKYNSENKEKRMEYYEKYKPRRNEVRRKYYAENKEAVREAIYRTRHGRYGNASLKVSNAIIAGNLVKQPCEICGAEPAQAHHDDYNKPLDVRWLCKKHHTEWHKTNQPKYLEEAEC